ncbi:hypothetical protein GCM10009021_27340 [Halarchaeum nitratireducens]|uniref:DUF8129 domain-containing protein n=1 Tax=Halarchaeum nitratireducens TaxID=489913 RepID=A0A830GFF9_9EURY|nr:hypothetical protein GCM10009021_27340 [Halarchaeum nitratireducens]
MTEHAEPTESSELTPEQRLSPTNTHVLRASIVTIDDTETLRECVAYENTHQNREPVLRWISQQAAELRSK